MRRERRNLLHDLAGVRGEHVMGEFALELAQPPRRDLGEHRTLVRHEFIHHDVERADTITRHEQQAVGIHGVHVAHLAPAHPLERQFRPANDNGHTRTSSCARASPPAR
jgi:hypothetical protein